MLISQRFFSGGRSHESVKKYFVASVQVCDTPTLALARPPAYQLPFVILTTTISIIVVINIRLIEETLDLDWILD